MKNINKLPVCLILLLGLVSCENWLDVQPKTKVKSDDLLKTEQGFKDALIGVYTLMKAEDLYARELSFGFIDAVAGQYDTYNNAIYNNVAQWKYETDINVRLTIDNIWKKMYNTIANVNNILDQIDSQKGIFTGNNYSIIKGEALGIRAFLHFDLLRLFGSSDLSKPAIPYTNTLTSNVIPTSTGEQVIELLKTDLKASTDALAQDPIHTQEASSNEDYGFMDSRNMRFNYFAAKATLARVYLWANDRPGALKEAEEIISECDRVFPWVTSSSVSTNQTKDRDYTFSTEQIFGLHIMNLKDIAGAWFTSALSSNQLYKSSWNYEEMYEKNSIGSSDYRLVYLSQYVDAPIWGYVLYKYYQPENFNKAYAQRMPLLRRSEIYYIAAECSIGVNNPDAIHYLNEVRRHRGISTDIPETAGAEQIQEEVLKEYRKEFQGEGQLFYYCKRHKMELFPDTWTATSDAVYNLPLPEDEKEFGKR